MADLTVTSAVDTFIAAANQAAMLAALNITLGGAFSTSGSFSTTLTVTGNTNITLPTSGTLAVLGGNTFTGVQTFSSGSVGAPSITFGDASTGFYRSGSGEIAASIAGVQAFKLSSQGRFAFNYTNGDGILGTFTSIYGAITIRSNGNSSFLVDRNIGALSGGNILVFSDTGQIKMGIANDVCLARDSANVLAQRNGTSANTFSVYGTYTDASNYVRLALKTTSTTMSIACETAGTGVDDIDLNLTPAGNGKVCFGTHSAVGAESVTGFISIKDSGGTLRKIAIIS